MSFTDCNECGELLREINKRVSELETMAFGAQGLAKIPAGKTSKQFARALLEYQLTQAEVGGLRIALGIHQRVQHHDLRQPAENVLMNQSTRSARSK